MFNSAELIKKGRVVDLYLLARYCYRVGNDIMTDSDYRLVENFIKENNLCPDVVNRSYDDDPVPMSLLEEFGMTNLLVDNSKYFSKYDSAIEDEKSMSIRAVENYKDSYDYFMSTKDQDKVMSPKINGVNCKSAYTREIEDNEEDLTFKISKSRARNGQGFNLTKNMSRIIPNKLDLDLDNLLLFGECVVLTKGLSELQSTTGNVLKVERMAALSMLRTTYPDEDYKYLKYKIFRCEGLSDSLSESLDILRAKGMDTVPYLFIKAEEVPSDFKNFCTWLKGKMDYFYELCIKEGYPTDGIVVDVDDVNYTGSINGQYSSKNIALKFEYWSHEYYIGVVEDIVFQQCSVECSVTAIIEPTKTADGCDARRVNLHSPAIMMSEGILPGKKIYFKRNSGVINLLVYGKELQDLLGGVVD